LDAADQMVMAEVARRLDLLAEGRPLVTPLATGGASSEVVTVALAVENLAAHLNALRLFSIALANGQIDREAPPNIQLLGPLKALQSSLKHLTWQAQEVAAGNLMHQVDFLGDFSAAFNSMVRSLREKRQAEQQMLHDSKLASIGLMAGGVAHEINTPLQYIDSNLKFVSDEVRNLFLVLKTAQALSTAARQEPSLAIAVQTLDDAFASMDLTFLEQNVPAALEESLNGAREISLIVTSMKEFSDVGGETVSKDLNRVVENALTVSHHAWFEVAKVIKDLHPNALPTRCRTADLGQVLLNLILNATQAIANSSKPKPGCICVATGKSEEGVFVRVSDSGDGISEAQRQSIFEPSFTTNPGDGRGLGLAMCRDVVENKLGGRIEVGGQEGEGAVLTVRIPHATGKSARMETHPG
jgi:signal transduction histidine kinase